MREFTIGGVLRRATLLLRGHAGLFLLLAVLLVAVPQLVLVALLKIAVPEKPGLMGLGALWYVVGGTFLLAIVTRVGVDDSSGYRSSPGELAGSATRLFFPLLMISILSAIVVGLASILLIVPGIMLLCRWYVALPVEIAERSGILGSFGRSSRLTQGVRWRLLGLILIVALIGLLANIAAAFAGGFVGGLSHNLWPSLAGQAIGTGLFQLVTALASTAAYLSLREVNEGTLSKDLVAIFE